MSQDNAHLDPNWDRLEEEESNDPTIREVVVKTLRQWPWLLLSIAVCCCLGVLWILRSPIIYTENAQLVLKNDSEGSSTAVSSSFSDLGIFSNNANVMNEIATMSSPDIMTDVVKMLDLQIEYFKPGKFHNKVLYGATLPIHVEFPDLSDEVKLNFKVNIEPQTGVVISKLKNYNNETRKWQKSDKTYKGKIDTPIKTDFGTIIIKPAENFSLANDYEVIVNKNSIPSAVNSYTKKLQVNLPEEDSTVIDLSISDSSRQRADEILAAVIAVYNDRWIQEKNEIAESTSKFIDERLGVIENELGNVDSDISQYKSANRVPDVQNMTASYIREQEELSKMSLDIQGQLQAAKNLRTRLTMAGNDGEALPANTTLENTALREQIKEYNDLLLKRNNLESKSSEKNPMVQQLDNEIRMMRSAILGSVDNAIQSLEGQLRTLNTASQSNTGRIETSPTQAKYLLSVERQQKVKENLYLFLLQKREDNALNQSFTALNTRIIKKPGGDGTPVAPKKSAILIVSFFIGIIIPFGYNYVVLNSDTKIRSRKDLEGMRTPMIGEIPLVTTGNKFKKKNIEPLMPVKSGSRDVINESFRVLRTNLDFLRVNKEGCNVVALTSFNPGSGKSFIAMNLGASFALKNKKILVIDGDLRRGTTSEYIGSPRKGLTDYLAGHSDDLKSLITAYPDNENLNVLPIGHIPPNPTELLESGRFEKLIEELRRDYDYILIDCPPIEVVADANIIDKSADRTIFVLRTGIFERSLLKELDKFYAEKKYNHLAIILNGTSRENAAYGNSGKYGYGE